MYKLGRKKVRNQSAFTIVELLVAIAVIGILAAITVVSYNEIVYKARVFSVKADLSNSLLKLKTYRLEYGTYPTALDSNDCPTGPTVNQQYCKKQVRVMN